MTTDGRVIEAGNYLEGLKVSFPACCAGPKSWWLLPQRRSKPTWGEPYPEIVARMRLAMKDAAEAAAGHEAVIVSHQLPIWMARCDAEGRRLVHDPRKRECTLASITSFSYIDGRVTSVSYREPAADLLRAAPDQEVRRGCLVLALIRAAAWPARRSAAGGRCLLACCSPAARVPAPTSRPAAGGQQGYTGGRPAG